MKCLKPHSKLDKTQPASCQSAIWVSRIHLETGIVTEHMETLTVGTAITETMVSTGLCHSMGTFQLLRTIGTNVALDALPLPGVVVHGQEKIHAHLSLLPGS